nr:putative retrotransposon Gag domain, nucleotide-binding alpha-beta plait domain protein [Tanacetum cinerariifolium]
LNLNIIFLLLFLFQHSGGIWDTWWKRVPSMNNKIYLNWRLRFLDWRRWWNLDVVFCMIWVCVRLLYTCIFLWINGFGRIGNGRSFSNKSTASSNGFNFTLWVGNGLPGRVPDPEVEAVFIYKRLAIMFLISLIPGCVKLPRVVPPIEAALHYGGIQDMRKRRVPSMQNKISLNRRLRFLDWRRWWDLDCVFHKIWVRVHLLYTFILLWINGFGRIGNGRSISNKSTTSSNGFKFTLRVGNGWMSSGPSIRFVIFLQPIGLHGIAKVYWRGGNRTRLGCLVVKKWSGVVLLQVIGQGWVVLEGLESDFTSIREDFRVVLNTLSGDLKLEIHDLKDSFMGEIMKIREDFRQEVSTLHQVIEDLQADMALCKRSLASGGGNTNHGLNLEVPKPSSFVGKREARAVDDFW